MLLDDPPAPAPLSMVPAELAVPALSPQSLVQGCSVANGKADDVEDAMMWCMFPAIGILRAETGLFFVTERSVTLACVFLKVEVNAQESAFTISVRGPPASYLDTYHFQEYP